ncbi:MAG: TIGR02530 family flagellar biosynthesis protein [Bacillota bacterium]|nr:TIGR02530 family flagellar biosynthesis protein [Bacillota bacterium]
MQGNDWTIRKQNAIDARRIQANRVRQQLDAVKQKPNQPSFQQVLEQLTFSKHATERLQDREIRLTSDEMKRLRNGVDLARSKGVREALILMDNKVFVASVKNNKVITASTQEQLNEKVFTNIDGAVIV